MSSKNLFIVVAVIIGLYFAYKQGYLNFLNTAQKAAKQAEVKTIVSNPNN